MYSSNNIIPYKMSIKHAENNIPEYFAGKKLFVTGGLGFMGKCLIEKLLRSCPDIGNIYMLLRSRKGMTVDERMEKFKNDIVFTRLKGINELSLKKLLPVEGDVSLLNLGMSIKDREIIINNVTIVYHIAATVRFTDPLKSAILTNIRGAREVCELVLELKTVSSFMHVSTAYCQLDKQIIEEKLYPPHGDWREAIDIAENINIDVFNILTKKYIDIFPNTYTFTKSLAEHVINDLCGGKVPTIILRPAVVVGAVEEPIPGYMDNFNGPIGNITGLCKGVIRLVYADKTKKLEVVPVDTSIKGMIIATWVKGSETKLKPISWYSISGKNAFEINLINTYYGKEILSTVPGQLIWHSELNDKSLCDLMYSNFIMFYIQFVIFQLIPSIIGDLILKLLGKTEKVTLLQLQRMFYIGSNTLSHFLFNEWYIVNDNFLKLEKKLSSKDEKDFSYNLENITENMYIDVAVYIEKNIIKTNLESRRKTQPKFLWRLWAIHVTVKTLFYFGIIWCFYKVFLETTLKTIF